MQLPGAPALISAVERQGWIVSAQALMQRHGFSALLIEAGSSLIYFTDVQWRIAFI